MTEPGNYLFEDVKDAKLEKAELHLKKAAYEAESANDDRRHYTKVYKTKERQLHYAQIKALIERARVASVSSDGLPIIAVDALDSLEILAPVEVVEYIPQGAVLYAAFQRGVEILVSEALEEGME